MDSAPLRISRQVNELAHQRNIQEDTHMGRKPGRGSFRTTGDKRSPGQEQSGGAMGPIRDIDRTPARGSEKKLEEIPRNPKQQKAEGMTRGDEDPQE
jgi:hypothetical protein